MRKGFRIFPHTSEAGLEITARDWPSFYRNAAAGLLALYGLGPSRSHLPEGAEEVRRSFEAQTPEDLLVCWLSELIFLIETERRVPRKIDFLEAGPKALRARLHGDRPRENRLPLAREIKAVTYHGLKVENKRGLIKARVILDV